MIKVNYDSETGEIYAGNITKNGFGAHYNKVTEDCIIATMNHIVNMRMTSDNSQEVELKPTIFKHSKKAYKLTIKIEEL